MKKSFIVTIIGMIMAIVGICGMLYYDVVCFMGYMDFKVLRVTAGFTAPRIFGALGFVGLIVALIANHYHEKKGR